MNIIEDKIEDKSIDYGIDFCHIMSLRSMMIFVIGVRLKFIING